MFHHVDIVSSNLSATIFFSKNLINSKEELRLYEKYLANQRRLWGRFIIIAKLSVQHMDNLICLIVFFNKSNQFIARLEIV